MDTVFIEELRVETIIGLYPWEEQVKQPLLISLEVNWDNRRAAATGDLQYGLDYAAVVKRVQSFALNHGHKLLESFAEDLAKALISEFSIPSLVLRVAKTTVIPEARQVGISIERKATDYLA